MLLCFHRAGQLKIGVPQENTINLEYHMRLYCSTLIKTGDHTTGSSIFSYYQKLNLTEFFILYCLTGDNFHALFGRRGFPYESGPLLMNRLYTDSVLRQVMCTVAERAASQLLYYVAIHVWLVLTNQAVMKEEEHNVRQYLHNALHVLVPAVAIALQSGPEAVRDIQCDVGAAKVAMDKVGNLVSPSDRGEWDCVLTMVTAYDLYNNLSHQQCYETVFRLPFIPTSEQEVSDCVMKYQSCSSSVITGMSCILNLFAESANHLLSYFNPYGSSAGQTSSEDQFNRIKTQVYIILQWYRKCCASGSTSGAFPPTLTKLSEIWYSTNPRF
ncbi:hypothetical protein AGDE_14711 [Angomonas deanei]|uniref:Uncharacterized protein n=1 Tax=Angomonas deanei TaxID=59799 RepID=A0A7G2C6A2_9TRYP|nr:hypothetical protein AGDE_14711 [Angomonas deanei]CAD2215348.1 hypothetical protein, conserved [Angomonas deanei]|eukprot:EPY20374.1 hypothetical protein AGDE_14711 [Angomonas deanei]